MKQRIWELDAARGLAVLGMVMVHFLFDLSELTGILRWREPVWFLLVKNHCGGVFLVISGISVTLGSHNIRRGIQVLLCGGLVTGVTYGMYALGLANGSIVIYFGVLQCLGVCMLLWSLLRRLPHRALLAGGVTLAAAGLVLGQYAFPTGWYLIPLGFCPEWFRSSDYFPLLPHLGYFMLGACLGRTCYRDKTTRFPGANQRLLRPLCALGRNSLWVYLLHQPLLLSLTWAIGNVLG